MCAALDNRARSKRDCETLPGQLDKLDLFRLVAFTFAKAFRLNFTSHFLSRHRLQTNNVPTPQSHAITYAPITALSNYSTTYSHRNHYG